MMFAVEKAVDFLVFQYWLGNIILFSELSQSAMASEPYGIGY